MNLKKNNCFRYILMLFYGTNKDKVYILLAFLLSVASGSILVWNLFVLGDATGTFIRYGTMIINSKELYQETSTKAVQFCLAGIFSVLATYISGLLFTYSANNQIYSLRKNVLKKILAFDVTWFDSNETVDLATVLTENFSKVENGIGENLLILTFYSTIFIGATFSFLCYGGKLTVVCLAPLIIILFLVLICSFLSSKYSKKELEASASAGFVAEEVLSLIKTVIAFSGQENECMRYRKYLLSSNKKSVKKHFYLALNDGFLWLLVYGCFALIFYFGVDLIVQRKVGYTPQIIVSCYLCIIEIGFSIRSVISSFENLGTASGAAAKIFDILNVTSTDNTTGKPAGITIDKIHGNIIFNNVSFHYPARPSIWVLNKFSLEIHSGQTLALVGTSGCGKTTCIQLLLRFFEVNSGSISVDNIDVRQLDLTWLRKNIGVVSQEPVLFSTTILENIKLANPQATKAEIEDAAVKANAHHFILELPQGYETVIGDRGTQLSGGQKQRIAIARALVRHPKILLLDEATSALDAQSENEVQSAIDNVRKNCTTIIVAHRLSTIRKADNIVVLQDGKIVESGSHTELITKKKHYYNLLKTQIEIKPKGKLPIYHNEDKLVNHMLNLANCENPKHSKNNIKSKVETSLLLSILRMSKPELLFIIVACLASVITALMFPIYGLLYGEALTTFAESTKFNANVHSQTLTYSLYILGVGILGGLSNFCYVVFFFAFVGEKLVLRFREKMFTNLTFKGLPWFDLKENKVGVLCSKLSDAVMVQAVVSQSVGTTISVLSTLIISNAVALYFQLELALTLQVVTVTFIVSILIEVKIMNETEKNNSKSLELATTIAVEAVSNIKTVLSLGCAPIFYLNYKNVLKTCLLNKENKKNHLRLFLNALKFSYLFFCNSAVIWYGGYLVGYRQIHFSIIGLISQMMIMAYISIGGLVSATPNFHKGLSAASRVLSLVNDTAEEQKDVSLLDTVKGKLNLKNINFAYPTRPTSSVLKNFSLEVHKGKTVALVGPTGCGKTTIIQLLQRFYDPLGGAIFIDDSNINSLETNHLRSHIGVVSQEPDLFNRTIAENIAYGANSSNFGFNEIILAAKMANIHDFITSLPLKYETNLGRRGEQLSGGQKQRIAIARALIRNPKILLLDEATSALDYESEKVVQEALDSARKDRTCIVIAHRLSAIQNADLICVLDKGTVVEIGNHESLLEAKGLYYKFYGEQHYE